jgi:hypothetical protein
MEFLATDKQCVADLSPDDQNDYVITLYIIKDTEIPYSQFELGRKIRP